MRTYTLTLDRQHCVRVTALLIANGMPPGIITIDETLVHLLNAENIPFVLHCHGDPGPGPGPVLVVDENRVPVTTIVCNNNETMCSICMEVLTRDESVMRLQCEHMFHADCVRQWVQTKNQCPLCRAIIPAYLSRLDCAAVD